MNLEILKVVALIIGEIVVGLATAYVTVRQLRTNMQKSKAEGESALGSAIRDTGDTLEAAWKEIRELKKEIEGSQAKIKELDKELVKFSRGYYRSLKFIRDNVKDATIPDFLLDTDPKIAGTNNKAALE